MAFHIEESFRVEAPPERVWAYLIDPERVVRCLPGAELVEVVDERDFRGRIRVSVGPVTAAYHGTATFAEVDDDARRVRVEARGEEASGPGGASMTMESTVTAADGGAEVRVTADVEVAGKIVQFGRGMIETVSKQLFRQFTECARSTLEEDEEARDAGPADTRAAAGEADGRDAASRGRGDGSTRASSADEESAPLSLLPLLFSSLMEKIRGLFGRR